MFENLKLAVTYSSYFQVSELNTNVNISIYERTMKENLFTEAVHLVVILPTSE